MSKEAEEIARRALEVWNSENWVEEAAELDAADIVVVAPAGWPESGTFEGQEAWHRQIKRLKEVWTEERYTTLAIEAAVPPRSFTGAGGRTARRAASRSIWRTGSST